MLTKLNVRTSEHTQMLDITAQIQAAVKESGVKDGSMYLARSGGDSKVYDNVTYINCSMSGVIASGGWYASPLPNPSSPTAVSGWKEYGSTDAAGKPLSGHSARGKYLTADEAAAFSSRQAVLGW